VEKGRGVGNIRLAVRHGTNHKKTAKRYAEKKSRRVMRKKEKGEKRTGDNHPQQIGPPRFEERTRKKPTERGKKQNSSTQPKRKVWGGSEKENTRQNGQTKTVGERGTKGVQGVAPKFIKTPPQRFTSAAAKDEKNLKRIGRGGGWAQHL